MQLPQHYYASLLDPSVTVVNRRLHQLRVQIRSVRSGRRTRCWEQNGKRISSPHCGRSAVIARAVKMCDLEWFPGAFAYGFNLMFVPVVPR